MLLGNRQRDRPRPGSDVEHARLGKRREMLEGSLDEHFRLRPRDQRAAVDLQREPSETPHAEDVGERLSRAPPLCERLEPACFLL
jgi:hypothetical protein